MPKSFWTASIIVLLMLGFAGCGGDDDDDSGVTADDDVDDDAGDDDADDDAGDDDTWPPLPDDDASDDDAEPDHVSLLDAQGREIVLHGANYMAIESGATAEDYVRMASQWGFNAVRILITWQALEPEEGVYDPDYLSDVVEPQVEYAADAGLMVILDMHQYHWSTCCGGMGIPEWTCADMDDSPLEWLFQSGEFWNHPEYVDAFVAAWEIVAEHFRDDERVFAYDLFNEPLAGLRSLPWTSENPIFRPFFIRLIDAVRALHPEPYLIFEPSMISVAGFPVVMDPIDRERLIYGPHLYPGTIAEGGAYTFPKALIEAHLTMRKRETDRLGAPLLIGETGLRSEGFHAAEYARDVAELMDRVKAHWTWWAFGYDDGSMGLNTAGGDPKPEFQPYLARPYPRAVAGVIRDYVFDPDTGTFTLEFTNDAATTPEAVVYVNDELHYPDGFDVSSSDPDWAWSRSFDADANLLTILADPGESEHTIAIRPAE